MSRKTSKRKGKRGKWTEDEDDIDSSRIKFNNKFNPLGNAKLTKTQKNEKTSRKEQRRLTRIIVDGFRSDMSASALVQFIKMNCHSNINPIDFRKTETQAFFTVATLDEVKALMKLNGIIMGDELLLRVRQDTTFIDLTSSAAQKMIGLVKSRFDARNNSLNLSQVAKGIEESSVIAASMMRAAADEYGEETGAAGYVDFSSAPSVALLLSAIRVTCHQVSFIDLSDNALTSLSLFHSLHKITPSLTSLSLEDNLLESVKELENLKECALSTLILRGNPFCSSFGNEILYRSSVKGYFPSLTTLDSIKLPSYSFSMQKTQSRSLPFPRATFFPSDLSSINISSFLQRFFASFDGNRGRLFDFYTDESTFSLTTNSLEMPFLASSSSSISASTIPPISTSPVFSSDSSTSSFPSSSSVPSTSIATPLITAAPTTLSFYCSPIYNVVPPTDEFHSNLIQSSRNLLMTDNLSSRISLLKVGRSAIVAFLGSLFLSDTVVFSIDVVKTMLPVSPSVASAAPSSFTSFENIFVVTTTGRFREIRHGTSRGFVRTLCLLQNPAFSSTSSSNAESSSNLSSTAFAPSLPSSTLPESTLQFRILSDHFHVYPFLFSSSLKHSEKDLLNAKRKSSIQQASEQISDSSLMSTSPLHFGSQMQPSTTTSVYGKSDSSLQSSVPPCSPSPSFSSNFPFSNLSGASFQNASSSSLFASQPSSSNPLPPSNPAFNSLSDQTNMMQQVMQSTNFTAQSAWNCLSAVGWDIAKAAELFKKMKEEGKLTSDMFANS
ncbi:putative TAP Cterminal subfamily protein [Monocercomonoides exilis]|uniref:putative TAP Cterminal subfamily protein n=1 Tax=Monocercomonoides exilis TaxID=2049356 RepID=UPI003559F394|nr:putative TAP Cterminal subfamily protein [Monocercomonoides exilis]